MPTSPIPAGISPNDNAGWSFSTKDNSLDQLLANPAKLLVLDYSRDGSEARRYQPAEINALHDNGQQVISYLSIGEAEEYRYYFQNSWQSTPPSWLGRTNPDWPDNIKVQYWNPDWQNIMLGYLDKIIASGFDGVYLDIVDGFDYWSNPQNGEGLVLDRADAAQRMIDWIEKLTAYARVTKGKPDFYIIPQNAEALLPYDTTGKFLRQISAVGVEDLYYDGTKPQSANSIAYRSTNLDKILAAGKPVLVIDYVNDQSGYQGSNQARIDNFWERANAAGYTPQVSSTDRTQLAIDPINSQILLAASKQTPSSVTSPAATLPTATPLAEPLAPSVAATSEPSKVSATPDIWGSAHHDFFLGNDVANRFFGGNGNDDLNGQGGDDYLVGNGGNDRIDGGDGADTVYGEWDSDYITGGTGSDLLWGNDGQDTILGGDGDDRIVGDRGDDLLSGGAGRDVFVYENFIPSTLGRDTITDFEAGIDRIELRSNIFTELADRNWRFQVVNSAQAVASSSSTIVYDQSSGNLFYNDQGDLPAVNFANLATKPLLSLTDFQVR